MASYIKSVTFDCVDVIVMQDPEGNEFCVK